MNLNKKQLEVKAKIEEVSKLFNIDPAWASSVAMTESSLGINQLSKTGCKGVFQLSSIAMKDLLQEMAKLDDDLIDVVCGVAFLRVLLQRWETVEKATIHFCDPLVAQNYLITVNHYMKEFGKDRSKIEQT